MVRAPTRRIIGAVSGPAITVVASASEGLYASISALVHPGDEVIYFEPSFDSYGPIVQLQGATPIPIMGERATGRRSALPS